MRENKVKFNVLNVFLYLGGFILVGLGVNLLDSSTLGMGAWDTVTFNIHDFIYYKLGVTEINFGLFVLPVKYGFVSMGISLTLFTVVISYRRKVKLLFMLLPVFLMGTVINIWHYQIFNGYIASTGFIKTMFFIFGLGTLPLGLVFIIKSSFPAFVFDELTFMIGDIFKVKSFGRIRLWIEITGISIGTIFGALAYLSEGHLGAVNVGSFVIAYLFAPVMAFYLKLFKVTTHETSIKEDFSKIWNEIKISYNTIVNQLKLNRIIKYLLGMVAISLGVVMMLRSDLGNSSWDALHFSLSNLINITIGTATILVALIFTILVIWLNRNYKFLIMAVPILIVGPMIDLFNDVILIDFEATTIFIRILSLTSGILLLPLGGALLLSSTYPAGVFDEFNLVVMRKLKLKSLVPVRVIMELSAVSAAYIFGLMAGIGYGKIHVGTLIFAFTVGVFLKLYLKLFDRIGISENQKTD
jgi:uncharacterized membrane protein YczE